MTNFHINLAFGLTMGYKMANLQVFRIVDFTSFDDGNGHWTSHIWKRIRIFGQIFLNKKSLNNLIINIVFNFEHFSIH